MKTKHWSEEELRASVEAYLKMWEMEQNHIPFVKKEIYETLSESYGRSVKAYEYRMQNISSIFAQLDRPWVTGLKPAKNVGSHVAEILKEMIIEMESRSAL